MSRARGIVGLLWAKNRGIYPEMTDTSCISTKLRRAGQHVARLYDEALAPSGLSVVQFSQLEAVRRLEAPSIGELAEDRHLDRSTLGRNVRTLARLGLVHFAPGEDERTRVVTLTDKGRAALKIATARWQAAQNSLADKLGAEKRAVLFDLLDELETLTP